ncbi:MAG TPA: DUF4845 domain-containing protein [Pseudomonadales bacterium]|nr:DUF4845 domain-containing protein [Pseudomonadales bacterium]
MKTSKKLQQGATFWEMSLYISAFLFVITVVLKLAPLYIDDKNIASSMDGVHAALAGKDINEVTNSDIKGRLGKFFEVSMLPDDLLKQVEVVREGGKVLLKLDYEKRQPFMGNVDIVLRFNHQVDLAEPISK